MVTLITLSRFLLVFPACALLLFGDSVASLVWALGLLNLMELTDLADGLIARRDNMVSDLGKLLDPLVDSLCRTTVFVSFVAMMPSLVPLWIPLVLFYRDMMVAYMRSLAAIKNFAMGARWSGKTKAALQVIAIQVIVVLLVADALANPDVQVTAAGFFAPIAATVLAGIAFIAAFRIWDRMLWVVVAFLVFNVGLLTYFWFARPAFAWAHDAIFWIMATVALVTALSLLDYMRVVVSLWREESARA